MAVTRELILRNGQRWILSSALEPDSGIDRLDACMLVSGQDLPLSSCDRLAHWAIDGRCPAISVVAPNANAIEDHVDAILEDREAFEVVTTADSDLGKLEDNVAMVALGMVTSLPLERSTLGADVPFAGTVFVQTDSPELVESALRSLKLLD